MQRVILLHGKDKDSSYIWYPWITKELSKRGVQCITPNLPHADAPKIAEWLAAIDALAPDQETILVGHSRGGMAISRWLEQPQRRVAKVVLVAANSATMKDLASGDFYSGPYNFRAMRANCRDFIVMHSQDDPWVPYEAALENTAGLNAKLITFDHKGHFGVQPDGIVLTRFPELLNELVSL